MEKREHRNEAFDLRLDMEIVVLATGLALAFPFIFLYCNKDNIPQANTFLWLFWCLLGPVLFTYLIATGHIFPLFLSTG